jgi:hypothetical protein
MKIGVAHTVYGACTHVQEERKLRTRAQDDFAECRKLVEASSVALEEWVPMMDALKRTPAVTPGAG